ncbi:hypothetical protein D0Z00_004126 [Geotrichum galactomycetum]|uniref:Uncharacterized protein n=1 Tax=Geotrichum galactomycetum TaxID=27317 RepID=A0ACB6UZE5_9ASCO|nr:hypothetical protein D0Z00_004126 [Geotrichum candidum]
MPRATIIIDLQGKADGQIIQIKRIIEGTATSSSTSWFINNRSAQLKDVKNITDTFNIQMDNLCQFLPQDKVSKFAELPSNELLVETERAVGSSQLIHDHEQLIELEAKQSSVSGSLESNKKLLAELQERQAEDELKVSRIKERKELESQQYILKKALHFIHYREVTHEKKAITEQIVEKTQELEAAKKLNRKFIELANQAASTSRSHMSAASRIDADMMKLKDDIEKYKSKVGASVQKLQGFQTRMGSIATKHKNERDNVVNLEARIITLQNLLEKQPTFTMEKLKEVKLKLRTVSEDISSKTEELESAKQVLDTLNRKMHSLESNKNVETQKLQRLNSVFDQKIQYLTNYEGRIGNDTAAAAEFITQNKNLFKHEVFLPPLFSMKIKDPSCLPQISSIIGKNQMFSFTCQTREDYQTFTTTIIDQNNWNVNVKEFGGTGRVKPNDHAQPCSLDQLRSKFGFDGYILDLLDGPEPVLNMLCHSAFIHQIPYCARDIRDSTSLLNAKDNRDNPLFRRYVDSRVLGALIKSKYGQRNISSRESRLGKVPGYMKSQNSGSDEAIKSIQNVIDQFSQEIDKVNDLYREKQSICDQLIEEKTVLTNELKKIKAEADGFREAEKAKTKFTVRLDNTRKDIIQAQKKVCDHHKDLEKVELDIKETLEEVKKYSDRLNKGLRKAVELQHSKQIQLLKSSQFENDSQGYQKFSRKDIAVIEKELDGLNRELINIKEKLKTLRTRLKETKEKLTAEQLDKIQDIYNDLEFTSETANLELARVSAKLELFNNVGEDALIARYNKRADSIAELMEKVSVDGSANNNFAEKIQTIRDRWEPELRDIVSRVSAEFTNAFKLIRCKGEVRLGNTDKGFKEWTIDIMVSFRDNTEMQVLNHQRQSGGERSISTIFYLISLQGLTKSPFRVVDEINQGMDQKNERIVHSRMVNVACQENSSQYFLITPKLLTDLEYHEKMKVHCIYSGRFVTDTKKMDFSPAYLKNLVKIARQLQSEEAA